MLTLKIPSLWGRRFKNSESFTTTVAVLLKAGLLTKEDVKKKLGVDVTDAFMKRCTAEDEDENEDKKEGKDVLTVQKAMGNVHGQRSTGAQTARANSGAAGRGSVGKTAPTATGATPSAEQSAKSR